MNRRTLVVGSLVATLFAGARFARAQDVDDEAVPVAREPAPPRQEPYGLPTLPQHRAAEGLAGAGAVELGGLLTRVDLASPQTAYAGALSGRIGILGFAGAMTYRVHATGALGGGSAGVVTRFAGDASAGPALSLSRGTRLFARIGMEAAGHADDGLQSSVYTLPSAYAGLAIAGTGFSFEAGPRAGMTLRSTYDPGNEAEGLRLHRRSRVRPSWGGSLALVSQVALLEAGLTRVEEHAGMWFVDGSACAVLAGSKDAGFVACANGQYWRALAASPDGSAREVPAFAIGASVGLGFLQIRDPAP